MSHLQTWHTFKILNAKPLKKEQANEVVTDFLAYSDVSRATQGKKSCEKLQNWTAESENNQNKTKKQNKSSVVAIALETLNYKVSTHRPLTLMSHSSGLVKMGVDEDVLFSLVHVLAYCLRVTCVSIRHFLCAVKISFSSPHLTLKSHSGNSL